MAEIPRGGLDQPSSAPRPETIARLDQAAHDFAAGNTTLGIRRPKRYLRSEQHFVNVRTARAGGKVVTIIDALPKRGQVTTLYMGDEVIVRPGQDEISVDKKPEGYVKTGRRKFTKIKPDAPSGESGNVSDNASVVDPGTDVFLGLSHVTEEELQETIAILDAAQGAKSQEKADKALVKDVRARTKQIMKRHRSDVQDGWRAGGKDLKLTHNDMEVTLDIKGSQLQISTNPVGNEDGERRLMYIVKPRERAIEVMSGSDAEHIHPATASEKVSLRQLLMSLSKSS